MNKALIMKLAKIMAKFAEIATDKGVLTVDGELAVGVEVYAEVEGELVAAEDGDYAYEDKVIVIAEGKVAEIREEEKEEVADEVAEEVVEVAEEMAEEVVEEVIEEPVAEEPVMDEKDKRIAELEAELAEKDERISALEAQLAELAKPVEEPVEMSKTPKAAKTSNPALKYFE